MSCVVSSLDVVAKSDPNEDVWDRPASAKEIGLSSDSCTSVRVVVTLFRACDDWDEYAKEGNVSRNDNIEDHQDDAWPDLVLQPSGQNIWKEVDYSNEL